MTGKVYVGNSVPRHGSIKLPPLESYSKEEFLKDAARADQIVTNEGNIFGKEIAQTTTRVGRDGNAIEVIFKDGSKIDITAARVKEWVPNLNPKAPPGQLQKVKFQDFIFGSKGYKRLPRWLLVAQISSLSKLRTTTCELS